jgi:hypothetical protein
VRAAIATDPIQKLMEFPFIGPITVWHLAKNLGLNVAKPDRHLVRISMALGFSNPMKFCNVIAQERGDPVRVVDLIIWRYMADHPMEFRALRSITAPVSKRGHTARAQQMVRTKKISRMANFQEKETTYEAKNGRVANRKR